MRFERILLIDDNDSDNVFHRIILRRAGFIGEVHEFELALDALDFLRTADMNVPTLIFLDINMPMMDGFQFATAAGPLIEASPTMMVVMLTSSGSPADRARAEQIRSIHGFLTKPLTAETVKGYLEG